LAISRSGGFKHCLLFVTFELKSTPNYCPPELSHRRRADMRLQNSVRAFFSAAANVAQALPGRSRGEPATREPAAVSVTMGACMMKDVGAGEGWQNDTNFAGNKVAPDTSTLAHQQGKIKNNPLKSIM
jgi:hypothetical protein